MKKYRSKTISGNLSAAAYIKVFQRPGEPPLADIVLMDGDRTTGELARFEDMIREARALMVRWSVE